MILIRRFIVSIILFLSVSVVYANQSKERSETYFDVYGRSGGNVGLLLAPRFGISTYYLDRFKFSYEHGEKTFSVDEEFGNFNSLELSIIHDAVYFRYFFYDKGRSLTEYDIIDKLSDSWYVGLGVVKKSFILEMDVDIEKPNASPFSEYSDNVIGKTEINTYVYEVLIGQQWLFWNIFLGIDYYMISNVLYSTEAKHEIILDSNPPESNEAIAEAERDLELNREIVEKFQSFDGILIFSIGVYF